MKMILDQTPVVMGCIIGENNCLPFLTQDDIDEATELNKSMVALLNRNLCSYQSMINHMVIVVFYMEVL